MAFYRFILALLENREITIFEDGNQTRDFTFVDDIITGTELACNKGYEWPHIIILAVAAEFCE